MNLKSLLLKSDYDSSVDDIYNDFYSEVLKVSSIYSRVGGFFSSETLAICASGIQEFIKNSGQMRLVLIPKFTKEDIDAIEDGLLTPERYINREWIKEFEMIGESFRDNHIKALAWMVANGYLEIRIALIKDKFGKLLDFSQIEKDQILYEQIGIFSDDNGNSISFRGTVASMDTERIRVFKNWVPGQQDYINNDYQIFQKFWDFDYGQLIDDSHLLSDKIISTIPISNAIKERLIYLAPKNKEEINLIKPPPLRPYQLEALEKFSSNNHIGIFEMATGTGKTITAIGCLHDLEKKESGSLLVVIVCPYINLVSQWKSELSKWGYSSIGTDVLDKKKWIGQLTTRINDLIYRVSKKPLVIVTTYDTFSSKDFIKIIRDSSVPSFIIADEVHSSGSKERKNGLISEYKYRLGLSATPERYFDDDGTKIIMNYFDKVVYDLNLEDAIKQGFLCKYKYYPFFVGLTDKEVLSYKKLTQKIIMMWNAKESSDKRKKELLESYIFERTRIITNAKNKIVKFREIVDSLQTELKYSLVYCSERQMEEVQDILNSRLISNHKITANIPKKTEDRMRYLEMFELGNYDTIIAIKVLDEGLNIPAVKTAIILASTGNPKQYIQRRGRVLRKFNGTYKDNTKKEFANIFDVLVIPDITLLGRLEFYEIERSIVQKEILRYEEFARLALNSKDCLEKLQKIRKQYDL